jgi:hemolysin activation/secretion protein
MNARLSVFVTLFLSFGMLPTLGAATPEAGHSLERLAPLATPEFKLEGLQFDGNTLLLSDTLLQELGPVLGKRYDLAGLQALADRITNIYTQHGYMLVRAELPPQEVVAGFVHIRIFEAHLAPTVVQSDTPHWQQQAQPFVAQLQEGAPIRSDVLERTGLLLSDLPGVQADTHLQPGAQDGQAALRVTLNPAERYSGEVGLDNQGNRFSGQQRAHANLNLNSPFMLGDQIKLYTLTTDEALWLGSLSYGLPLGGDGLRGNLSLARTSYQLGKDFASLQAYGTAKVVAAGLSYPWLRSQQANLNLLGNYQYKQLHDNKDSTQTNTHKTSQSLPLTAQFDWRDNAGGSNYGALTWTPGRLRLDSTLLAADVGQTQGRFQKLNLDATRVQQLSPSLSLQARVAAQWASQNLDSSESFTLGGPSGVRAYPTGESNGDEGQLTQLELRWAQGQYAPYVFHDWGRITVNANPNLLALPAPVQSRAGVGLGLRWASGPWRADASLAYRTVGGVPTSDTSRPGHLRGWFSLSHLF